MKSLNIDATCNDAPDKCVCPRASSHFSVWYIIKVTRDQAQRETKCALYLFMCTVKLGTPVALEKKIHKKLGMGCRLTVHLLSVQTCTSVPTNKCNKWWQHDCTLSVYAFSFSGRKAPRPVNLPHSFGRKGSQNKWPPSHTVSQKQLHPSAPLNCFP